MSTVLDAPVAANGVPLLQTEPKRRGPVSRRLVVRFVSALAVVEVAGLLLALVSGAGRARAAGLSMMVPGGGLLYEARPIAFVVAVAVMVLAVVLWWGASASWGVPLWWAVTVVASIVLFNGPRPFGERGTTWGWAVPVIIVAALGLIGSAVVRFERTFRRKRAAVTELNEYLASATLPAPVTTFAEPNALDVELLRWVYSMALQPLDDFDGFDWGEQYHGPTCVRYQLNFLGWALAVFAANYVPNAPATAERAMANLIVKHTDLRVWHYWRTMNLIGNFDRNPDPIVRDNIMLSAYIVDQINLYEAATGSTRFDEPGSLTFVWKDGRTFPYDHRSIAECVARNFQSSALGLFPCEPGWVFTFCNVMGAQALKGHDTMHGTELWPGVEPHWRAGVVGEMLTPDGHFPHIRSKLIGLSFDTGEVPGGEYYAAGTNRLADVAPDLARRGALLNMRGVPERIGALRSKIVDGELDHAVAPQPERSTRYRSAVREWTVLMGTARAVGEHEVADAARARMERLCATGKRWPERPLVGGAQTVGVHMLARWAAPLNTSRLALRGYEPPRGPVLAEPSPEVLVVVARSTDGASLDLVLHVDSPVATVLHFTQLTSGARYRLGEATFLAGDDGRGSVDLRLSATARLRLEPSA
jgi:hypothetical protein